MIRILCLFALLLPATSYAHSFENPNTWYDPQITRILATSKIIEIKSMKDSLVERGKKVEFDGQVFLVRLDNDIKAVFKSIPLDDQADAMAEVAAYQASLYLGFPYVPPTVLREVNGMKGSLQLFVDTKIDLLAKGEYQKVLAKASDVDNANLRIFYFVFGQWDSGAHNLLAYDDADKTYLVAIDNSSIRNHQNVKNYGDLPFVRVIYSDKFNTNDYGKPFPFDKAEVIKNPSPENLKKVFGSKLPDAFYENFNYHGQQLKYVIYNNSLWRQYHAFDKSFVRAYADQCPAKTIEALRKLDLVELQEIFAESKGSDFLTPTYLKNILKRRDQVVNKCAKGHLDSNKRKKAGKA